MAADLPKKKTPSHQNTSSEGHMCSPANVPKVRNRQADTKPPSNGRHGDTKAHYGALNTSSQSLHTGNVFRKFKQYKYFKVGNNWNWVEPLEIRAPQGCGPLDDRVALQEDEERPGQVPLFSLPQACPPYR